MHSNLLPKTLVDILQTSLSRLREQEENQEPIQTGRDDQHQQELPPNVGEGDGTGNEDDNLRDVPRTHPYGRALTADVRGKDLVEIQKLRGVHAGGPKDDKEVYEEDSGTLPSFVGGPNEFGLEGTFAD